MKVSLNWIKDYVDITIPIEELSRRLTMAGFEVTSIERIGENWDNVLVGQVKEINPHPNADRLTLPTVDLGGEEVTVVCGAPNLEAGQKIAFARVGARLIDGHDGKMATLKTAKVRGVESSGMVCSEKELGISDRHEGILVLPEDAPVGTPLADYMGDTVLNYDVTPNRPDCLSIIGIAREISALTGQPLHFPDVTYEEKGEPIDGQITIEINAPDLCPRYTASLIKNVKIKESPVWMQQRLMACGQRPISNIVDITNYIMLEYGQPLHSFDYDKIRGKKIIVRRASDYEPLTTLDGVDRELNSDMLVISDPMGATAVAGIMGGLYSEITDKTTNILLEAASFNPRNNHYTGRTLELASEASARYERGIATDITTHALKAATRLIAGLGGGEVARGIADNYPGKKEPEPIKISAAECARQLGVEYTIEQISAALTSLGMECSQPDAEGAITTASPYWRSDINIPIDLVEEVARILDYDNIPTTMLDDTIPQYNEAPIIGLKRRVTDTLAGYGYQETVTYSLTSSEILKKLLTVSPTTEPEPLRLYNPMTIDQECLRPNLRSNLLSALAANRRHESDGIRLFEAGKIFIARGNDLPEEHEMLCGLLSGTGTTPSWHGEGKGPDFYEAKGVIEALLGKLNITATFEPGSDESLHSANQAAIIIDGKKLGVVGEIHPKVRENFDIDEEAYMFELDMEALLPYTGSVKMFTPIPRFPAMVRDMALVIDADVTHSQITAVMQSYSLVKNVALFDVYSGKQVAEGKKSLAYRLTYQSPEHTLTDKEVNRVEKQILDRLTKELGATLRA